MIDFTASFQLSEFPPATWVGLLATAISIGAFALIALFRIFIR
jgi:hypothetical protein